MVHDTKVKLAQALRLIADALEQEPMNMPVAPLSEWLDEEQMLAEYGMGRNAADNRGIPRTRIGRRNKWKRTDIEASIKVEPHKPRAKLIQAKAAAGQDPFDALLASGAVVATRGRQ